MGWRSVHTIDVYDHSRDGEHTLQVLALMQQRLAERRYFPAPPLATNEQPQARAEGLLGADQHILPVTPTQEPLWLHDAETLAWVKKMQQHG